MSDWVEKPIRDLVEGHWSGEWGTEPTESLPPARVYRSTEIDDAGHLQADEGVFRSIAPSKDHKLVRSGDILVEASGGAPNRPVGRVAFATFETAERRFTSNFVRTLRPKKAVDNKFLSWRLHWLNKQSAIWRFQQQTTGIINLQVDDYLNHRIRLPVDKIEQKAIAKVLDLIDTQIQVMERLIAKQERVRVGLMRDLLTRGVDEHGQLRPPREQVPHLYHQTELGWLPLGWEAPELEGLLAPVPTPMRSGPFGSALLKHELVDSGVPFLGIDNIHVEHFKADFTRFVTRSKASELSRYRVFPDDVVITIMGTVGRCCVIPDGFGEMLSSKHLWTMSLDQSKALPRLVCWQLCHAPWVHSWFRKKSQGGIMDAIQSSTLKQLRLPTPTLPEQRKISAIYDNATSHLQQMREECAKLALQKSGLMQDLLTGKVSVAPLLKSAAA